MEKSLDNLPAEIQRKLSESVTVRRDDIRASLLADTAAISHSNLKDFDWKLKVCSFRSTSSNGRLFGH